MDALDFNPSIEKIAHERFQIKSLKPFQHQVISAFLNREDILLISSTGTGKSLCYQVPAMILPGTLIVISPLVALMQDQVQKLQKLRINAFFLQANQTHLEQQEILNHLKEGHIKLLYISPEKLLQARFLQFLKNQKISGFIIDEVHCMLQWGHDFRPEYQGLSCLKRRFPDIPIMAVTATASPKQQQQIIQDLGLNANTFYAKTERNHLNYQVIPSQSSKVSLEQILKNHPQQNGIIYAATRQRVMSTAQYLSGIHPSVLHYHAGLEAHERKAQQAHFESSDHSLMVATLAFGMGIDKANIRYIVHLDIPSRLDQFVQESGRAGRDGQAANSYLLYNPIHFIEFNLWKIKEAPPLLQSELIEELRQMAQFIHRKSCYQVMLDLHFLSETSEDCGKCGPCRGETINTQFSIESQLKLLSCLYRLGEHASSQTITDVLKGILTLHTSAFRELKTFGIGQAESKAYWYELLVSLFADNVIQLKLKDQAFFWQLTPQGIDYLKRRHTS